MKGEKNYFRKGLFISLGLHLLVVCLLYLGVGGHGRVSPERSIEVSLSTQVPRSDKKKPSVKAPSSPPKPEKSAKKKISKPSKEQAKPPQEKKADPAAVAAKKKESPKTSPAEAKPAEKPKEPAAPPEETTQNTESEPKKDPAAVAAKKKENPKISPAEAKPAEKPKEPAAPPEETAQNTESEPKKDPAAVAAKKKENPKISPAEAKPAEKPKEPAAPPEETAQNTESEPKKEESTAKENPLESGKREVIRNIKKESVLSSIKKTAGAAPVEPDSKEAGPGLISLVLDVYYRTISKRIQRNLILPLNIDSGILLAAQVNFHMRETGEVYDVGIEKSSGNTQFDSYCIKAVNSASPLPPPPSELRDRIKSEFFIISCESKK